MKCIQLVPVQFDSSIDYSVKNYIVQTAPKCYNIVSYNSSSTNLFSNECQELCPEQYCLLFDNQPNTSIINIFYSPLSNYDLINPLTNNILSYDYYLFDTCSSTNQTNEILLIVVYILCANVVILTIGVILKFIISHKLKRNKSRPYRPYDWYWILDCLFCQVKSNDEQNNKPERNSNDSNSVGDNNQLNNFTTSTQRFIISSGTLNTTNDPQNYGSDSSSNQRYHDLSSENNILFSSAEYIGIETENYNQPSSFPLLQKLSQKASSALSVISNPIQYTQLQARPSPDIIITRH